ncbi:MAG: efflux RND transporter permease subunit [Pseudomonadota bacterium]|uniref:Efflux RND transporter permease subunit n=1 Tax=Acinetobacter bereziniae TaxID=106648 RepID=A0A8I1ABI6_ACIBZ|nr:MULTISPECIES: efflux RND transporter permease subunit [Acinetobacter]MEC8124994.1 efflux RND transporter permease subunit [Pseudomonadota bacterium]MBJ9949653.1 efflux RND transporter permease subunit [Acinetobacter bereziniae]QQC83172.1 efflux RND transporter permease subunit [Acinetobacter bereziniae]UUN96330.1 efflux RND transporter permease subunit [Acinetobacter bereziniae]BCX74365.1 multidrug efflux system subunit B [Acinetobacter sp. Tol 5]
MNISRFFILRPVATTLLMLALLFSGFLVWRLLPVSALPQVDYPIIQVYTFQPGANPDTVQRTITAPLEREMGKIAGLKQMSSSSSVGASVITLQFELSAELGVVEQEVQSALSTASNKLPDDLPTPPVYRKVNPADVPVITLAISSDTLPLTTVYDMVDTRVAQKLSQLTGVGMVSLAGGQRPAIRVQMNPAALASYKMSAEQVRTAIQSANANQPKGSFDGPFRTTMLDANDQIRSIHDYENLILRWNNGAPIRLKDVAKIIEGSEDRYMAAWADSQSAILVNIQRQPNANVIQVADQIKQVLPELQKNLPENVKIRVLTDRTESIRSSIRDVQKELVFAVCLVVMVTFLFLKNLSATIIPSIAVPLSIIGTFVVMYFLGFSVNNLTLMALTIATGFVVDDAIVMLENIARHRESGENLLQAALKGAREIGFTLISLTVSLIAVLIPLLFMGDVVGRLFHEFAVTLAAAIAISLGVSLTLTPMMCAYLLKKTQHATSKKSWSLDQVIDYYAKGLTWVFRHQPLTLVVMLSTVLLAGFLYWAIPKGFFPVQDSGVIQVVTEAPDDISFQAMSERQQKLASQILKDPAVESLSSFIGVDANNPKLSNGRILINLKPHAERDDADLVMSRLRKQMSQVQGIYGWMQPVQELSIEDKISRTQYQLSLSATQASDLEKWTPLLVDALAQRSEFADVTSEGSGQGLQAFIEVNRDAASRLGLSVEDISLALQNLFAQRQIATLYTQSNQYRIVLELNPDLTQGLDHLGQTYIHNGNGEPILLSTVATIVQKRVPIILQQQAQFPASGVSFNLASGVALGDAIKTIHEVERQLNLPIDVKLKLQGAAAAFENAQQHTFWLVIAAIVTMYIVLGILYESFIHPITILSTLPSAAIGALVALFLVQRPLDMIALIGIILLIGLVKKNGIMMVDFALAAQRNEGLTPQQAIYQAALMRFRPILMTTLAALVGAIPLMLASGAGAELRQPLGIVMVGGLIVSQLLTLFTTPVVYLFFDRLQQSFSNSNSSTITANEVGRES